MALFDPALFDAALFDTVPVMTVVPEVDDFLNRFPEFLGVDEGRIEAALAFASTYISDDWIDQHQLSALLYLTAHILFYELSFSARLSAAISGGDQAAGPVTSKSVGPLSITYADKYATTSKNLSGAMGTDSPYLEQYQNLMRISFPAVLAVI